MIAADTTVELDGEILGKPDDDADARRMLAAARRPRPPRPHRARGRRRGDRLEHGGRPRSVQFGRFDAAEIDWYVATGEPFDKAGAYAIQGAGGVFVERVSGSVSNVVGLPLTPAGRARPARLGLTPTRRLSVSTRRPRLLTASRSRYP